MSSLLLLTVCLVIVAVFVESHPHFAQPRVSTESGSLLTNKCYAYSTINALKETGITHSLDGWSQTDADQFVGSLGSSMGGGPGVVIQKLKDTGKVPSEFQNIQKAPKRSIYTPVKNALNSGKVAIIIGAKKDGSRHWMYAKTPPSTDARTILAYDQQLQRTRTFKWVIVNQAAIDEKQTELDEWTAEKIQFLKELKDKVPRKDRTTKIYKSFKTLDAPVVPAAKYGYKSNGNWVMTKVAYIGANDDISTYRAKYLNVGDSYMDEEQIYNSQTTPMYNMNIIYGEWLLMATMIVLIVFALCLFIGFVIGYSFANAMQKKDQQAVLPL